MKIILLCLLFIPILYLAFKQKRWYLCLFFAFFGVLPEQFALDLHDKLPLLSGSRILILILFGFWLWDRWKTKRLCLPKSLLIFFVINVVVSAVNLRYGMGEIKRIFLLIFERVLLAIMVADMIRDREEFDRCIDFLIMGCTALSVVGILQTIFEYDIATPLHLVETLASVPLTPRMGMIRASGTYNAISFGCYCALMALPILYRLWNTKKQRYAVALSLDTVALICTLTRSAWLCLAGVFVLMLIFGRMKLVRRLLSSAGMVVALCLVLCLFQPQLTGAFVETGKSSINTVLGVLPDSVVSMLVPAGQDSTEATGEDAKNPSPGFELDEDFGMNGEDPTYSRMAQWTAVEHMIMEGNALFGLGYNALPEGRIHFFFDRWGSKWEPTGFLDVGLVALITEGGFVGALSFFGLLGFMFVYAFRKRNKTNPFDFYHIVIYLVPLFLLLNFLASFMFEDIVFLFIALFYAYKRITTDGVAGRDNLIVCLSGGRSQAEHGA